MLVFSALLIIGVPFEIALLLAAIATATDPAATLDTVHEVRAKGTFTKTLLGIVTIDDVWGLLIFSLFLSFVESLTHDGSVTNIIMHGLWEIGGAIGLGLALGIPLALLSGRIKPGESTQAEALGIVFLCAGIAVWLEVSYILTAIVVGAVIGNLIKHRCSLFHMIEKIEWPFFILFFLLAGASLHLESLLQLGFIGLVYIVFRLLGRLVGSQISGRIINAETSTRRWIGLALAPQAGVAIGMALLTSQRFPEFKSIILPVTLGTTVFFELVGPILTRWVLIHVGDAKTKKRPSKK
jgi:Kef-type K+ transport system membrane component KefB